MIIKLSDKPPGYTPYGNIQLPQTREELANFYGITVDELNKRFGVNKMITFPIKCFMLQKIQTRIDADGVETIIYERVDTKEQMSWETALVGAMSYAPYPTKFVGPDGKCLRVKIPTENDGSGETTWHVDSESDKTVGKVAWAREGVPPNVTVHPSIFVNEPIGYHGWLRDGQLILA